MAENPADGLAFVKRKSGFDSLGVYMREYRFYLTAIMLTGVVIRARFP